MSAWRAILRHAFRESFERRRRGPAAVLSNAKVQRQVSRRHRDIELRYPSLMFLRSLVESSSLSNIDASTRLLCKPDVRYSLRRLSNRVALFSGLQIAAGWFGNATLGEMSNAHETKRELIAATVEGIYRRALEEEFNYGHTCSRTNRRFASSH